MVIPKFRRKLKIMFSTFRDYFIFSTKSQLVFIDSKNREKFWIHEVDFKATPIPEKPKKYLKYNDETEDVDKVSDKQIDFVAVSEEMGMLAMTTNDKLIHLFKIEEAGLKTLSVRKFYRAPTQMAFSDQSKQLFFADKGGDCYVFSLQDVKKPGQWIFGHMSQILNLILSDDQKFLISCDRDEKIRISQIDEVPEIHSICIGHQQFVSCVKLLSSSAGKILVSLSGDKTMRVWDYKKGVQLQLLELDYVGMSISSVEINSNYVAIKSEKNCIYIYEYQFDEKNHLTLNLLISKEYSGYTEVLSKGPDFLIATSNDKSQISLEKISLSQENFEFEFVCNVNDTTKMEISSRNPDISFLFKKKFENQEEYLDRKRKKIK